MGPTSVLSPGAGRASICYFKRYKMEVDLNGLPAPLLPDGLRALPWALGLLGAHADALFGAFHQEIDAAVFPSLGDRAGCCLLMTEIVRRRGFVPEATWLLV